MPRIELRCTDAEKSVWVARAEERGVRLSEWVRGRLGSPPSGVTVEFYPPSGPLVSAPPLVLRDAVAVPGNRPTGKFDSKCVNAQYHWKGSCKICGV